MNTRKFKLPGFKSDFYTDKPIIPNGSFTWGEALHWDGETIRLPKTKQQVENIIKLAIRLQKFRNAVGKPVQVISWFRPDPWNTWAKGVSNSVHKEGGAVDLQVHGMNGRQLKAIAVKIGWHGGVGVYPPPRHRSLHLDIGKPRTWDDA